MRTIKEIILSGSASIEVLLIEAFEAGKAEGLAEAKSKFTAMYGSLTISAGVQVGPGETITAPPSPLLPLKRPLLARSQMDGQFPAR